MHHSGPLPLTFEGPEQCFGVKTAKIQVRLSHRGRLIGPWSKCVCTVYGWRYQFAQHIPIIITTRKLLTLTIGVMNSTTTFLLKRLGQKWCIKLIRSPLIWDPSWSWSVMIISLPYRNVFNFSGSSYFSLNWRPMILITLLISAFSIIWNKSHTYMC